MDGGTSSVRCVQRAVSSDNWFVFARCDQVQATTGAPAMRPQLLADTYG
jgi:hypothetical protein